MGNVLNCLYNIFCCENNQYMPHSNIKNEYDDNNDVVFEEIWKLKQRKAYNVIHHDDDIDQIDQTEQIEHINQINKINQVNKIDKIHKKIENENEMDEELGEQIHTKVNEETYKETEYKLNIKVNEQGHKHTKLQPKYTKFIQQMPNTYVLANNDISTDSSDIWSKSSIELAYDDDYDSSYSLISNN